MKLPTFSLKGLSKPGDSKLVLAIFPAFKEKRTQQFTTLVLTMITVIFFALFAINPTITTIFDLQKQLDDNTFVNDQLQKKIANLTTLQTKYADVEPQLEPVMAALPANPAIDVFVGQIHTISQQSNVQINRIQTFPLDVSPKTTTTAKYLSYEFAIEGQGAFSDIQKYITNLGSFNRLIAFENITVSRVGRIDSTFRVSVRGNTFLKGLAQ